MPGKIVAIYIAKEKGHLPISVKSVEVIAHRGLIGDRYCEGTGTYSGSKPLGPGREITLIEEENSVLLSESIRQKVDPGQLRRNVVTRGVRLNDLVGQNFIVGSIRMSGIRLCHPCAHLKQLTGWDVLTHLEGRGGLRADILDDGWLNVGDVVNIPQE